MLCDEAYATTSQCQHRQGGEEHGISARQCANVEYTRPLKQLTLEGAPVIKKLQFYCSKFMLRRWALCSVLYY
jgi:hypothetical protein